MKRLALVLALILATGCIRQVVRQPGTPLEEDPSAEAEAEAAPAAEPAPAPAAPAPVDTKVTFGDRTIDIGPHIQGFPYRGFQVLPEQNRLMYTVRDDTSTKLRTLKLDGELDLNAGEPVTDIDWNTRNLSRYLPIPGADAVLAIADEDNAEFFDLYRIELADGGSIRKLTDVPYIYGFGLDAPRNRFAYVARYPDEARAAGFRSCLELMSLDGGEATEVVCDDDALTFTWGLVLLSPDGETAFFRANLENDRARGQLLRVDLNAEAPSVVPITEPPADKRQLAGFFEDWVDGDRLLYASDETGAANIYERNVATGTTRQVTEFTPEETPLRDARLLVSGDVVRILATFQKPYETELRLLDLDGAVLHSEVRPANLSDLGHRGDSSWMYATSRQFKVDMFRISLTSPDAFATTPFLGMPPEDLARLVHCDVERVEIETFDGRKLHAYLSTPKQPPAEGERRLAAIVGFYGGGNYFDSTSQIYCEAGVTHLSPAVRGSWGFGPEFHQLNDGDLGGDEIIDLHYVARYLVAEHGFTPRAVGVIGGSHGGYAAMRALTFPPETNGRNEDFDYGWGISFYGFSDIKTFWETSNIPDWVLLEAGDPETEPDKIRDRSPLHHVDKLDSPILLLHGEMDTRVPVAESRQFAEACAAAGKECVYEEFAGQGHGLKGLANQARVWNTVFAFLESLPIE